jgi:hypothetical protein
LAKAKSGQSTARRTALLEIAKVYGKIVLAMSPVDTGRFKAAEAQGLNQAGAGPFPVQPIRPDTSPKAKAFRDKVTRTLTRQVEYWRGVTRTIEARGGTKALATGKENKRYKQARKNFERANQYLSEWVASEGTGAVIGVDYWQRRAEAQRRKDKDPELVLTRAYSKVYGGTGQLIDYNGKQVISLRNKEPHAYIVESNTRVRRNALKAMAGTVKRASNGYTKKLKAASGL